MLDQLAYIRSAQTGRASSWDETGRNSDAWWIEPGESAVLADIKGPGRITHLWLTQANHYRECLLKITYDDADFPSVVCPLGDFFGLGHGIVNSYQSLLFSASTRSNNVFNTGCALNAYAQMPFRPAGSRRAGQREQRTAPPVLSTSITKPATCQTRPGISTRSSAAKTPLAGGDTRSASTRRKPNIVNKEQTAWDNNYVILETQGRGHYIGCNISVTNFQGTWWGEGDDMIWVDGYKWPPELHGTGSEDYLNQAWGMQDNAFLRNGSSIHENNTNGYQTSYVHHLENPIHFQREIKTHHRTRPRQSPLQRDEQRRLLVRGRTHPCGRTPRRRPAHARSPRRPRPVVVRSRESNHQSGNPSQRRNGADENAMGGQRIILADAGFASCRGNPCGCP